MTKEILEESFKARGRYMEQIRVLVVEDDNHLLSGIRDILELENYHVLTAPNGEAGLTVLNSDPKNPPDVIISDIMMPHMNGFEFLSEVRKQDRWVTVPFIFLTAKGEKDDRHTGSRLGADVYLTKPFDAEDLLVAVSSTLQRQREIQRVNETEIKDQKRKILTILNHEFRTPLTLVVAYADMLKDFDPSDMTDAEVMTFLRGVNSGADRLRRLIENFIMLVELDSGEAAKTMTWRRRKVDDLRLIIEDAHRQIAMLQNRPRTFKLDIPDGLPSVSIDVQFMTIAIRELLDNAAKFSADNDTILLQVKAVDDYIEFQVQDHGRGIPEHEIENIWKNFYQVDRELFEDQGAGSGLAIIDGIVNLHGGTRHVESVVDEGSTFTMRIPLEPPATTSETSVE